MGHFNKQLIFLLGLFITTFFFQSCKRDTVKLIGKNFDTEVPTLGNLIFTFNKDVAADSVIDVWDSTQLIKFTPNIPGKFRWTSPSELVFSPFTELPPSTEYTAELTNKITKSTKYNLSGNRKFSFHTPYLELLQFHTYWSLGEDMSGEPFVAADLVFNFPVQPQTLASHIQFSINNTNCGFKPINQDESGIIKFQLLGLSKSKNDLESKVLIKKSFPAFGRENSLKKDISATDKLISPYRLEIQSLSADHDGVEGTIKIFTSQPVKKDEIERFINVSPELKPSIEVFADRIELKSESFSPGNVYTIELKKGLMGLLGGTLLDDYRNTASFGELSPTLQIISEKGFFLSAKGQKNVAVSIINIPKVKVSIYKIYENNILNALQGEEYYDSYYEDEYVVNNYSDYVGSYQTSDIIYKEEIETSKLMKNGQAKLLNLNIKDKLANHTGIYKIEIESADDQWISDSRIISISDLGLIAKRGKDYVQVYVNSISSAQPLSNVEVKVIGKNNQVIGTGKTESDGSVKVKRINKEINGFYPLMVSAKLGTDFTCLPFSKTEVNTSRFDVGGRFSSESGLDAYVYPERDLYRPGESIHLACIVRNSQGTVPNSVPVKLVVHSPDGKEFKSIRKNLNEQGSFEFTADIPENALTGSYIIDVLTANDIQLGSSAVLVEEFMPDRIKLNVSTNKKSLSKSEELQVNIEAAQYFGPPAADNNYEVEFTLKNKALQRPGLENYRFYTSNQNAYFPTDLRQYKLNAEGKAQVMYSLPSEYTNLGVLDLNIVTTVFDENGRPVNNRQTIPIYTQDIFYGIGDFSYWNAVNAPISIPLVAVDKKNTILSTAPSQIQIYKVNYKTVMEGGGSYYNYRSERSTRLLVQSNFNIAGKCNYSFTPKESGEYEFRIQQPGSESFISQTFYCYGFGNAFNASFAVDQEGEVKIETDKSAYSTGEQAKLLFTTPYAGKLLVTVERDDVIQHFWVNTDKKSASLNIPLSDKHVPNIYITATLLKPHSTSEIPLTVAHGFASIKVDNPRNKLNLNISAVKSSRSNTSQTISVKSAPGAYVTIAAVDEGILAMTGFQTPNPYNFFYGKLALAVKSYDMYALLFPELKSINSSTGADASESMLLDKRTNPLANKRVKLISYWSGLIKTDISGNASFTIPIPNFSGKLRIMAAAHKNNQYQSAQSDMTIADPLVISSGVPRFLSPGDTFQMPVNLTNSTSKTTGVQVQVTTEGPVKVLGSSSQNTQVNANKENTVVFTLCTTPQTGSARIKVSAKGSAEPTAELIDITVRPASTLEKTSGDGMIEANQLAKITINTNGFIPSSIERAFVIGKSPFIQYGKSLEYLVKYPYGCTEQSISAAFPQLYYADIAASLSRTNSMKNMVAGNIDQALYKIGMCQLYNGGISLWSDWGEVNWWTTVYACHFMIEAEKAGYDIDKKILDKSLGYLEMRLKNKESIDYTYNRDQKKKIAPKEVAYSLFVLSLARKPSKATMNYYASHPDLLSLDARYMLSAAFSLAGDKSTAQKLCPASFSGEESVPVSGGSFYSPLRDKAITLYTLLETNPNSSQIPGLAKTVGQALKLQNTYSTQELAFSLLALGKMAKQANQTNITAKISSGNLQKNYSDGVINLTQKDGLQSLVQVNTSGSGKLYYYWSAQGIPAGNSTRSEDKGLQIRRTYYDRFGKVIQAPYSFKQNDLIVVKLSLIADNENVDQVVVTDILPAGFEIENPRITDVPGTSWIKDMSVPQHADYRDDRVFFFTNASPSVRHFYYVVRCVNRGNFILGPATADAMYKPDYHSINGAGRIRISER